jgi:predicted PolB exonuclease-like 3'-5' exonuclease
MLKNPVHKLAVFFDMEWVPDAAGARRLFGLPADTPELEAMERLWKTASKYDAENNPRPFIKYLYSRIVSIAFLSRKVVYRDNETVVEYSLNTLPELPVQATDVDEAAIIERFLYILGKRCPQLVGYNSAESDLQVLIQRGMVNEVAAAEFCKRPEKPWEGIDYFRKWDNEDHLDLMKLFGGGRDMLPRLDELAKLCGFPGKIDVQGDQVTDLWLAGRIDKIVEYNVLDVLNTFLVWLRMVYFTGQIGEEDYANEQDEFRTFLEHETENPDRQFIGRFLELWPM